jgi:heat shock protein HslJ
MKSGIILNTLVSLTPLYIIFQSISTSASYDRSALYANSWNLVELNGESTLRPDVKQAYITFKPGDDMFKRITGFTGCNYIGGRIDLQGEDEITFHPDILTNNNCAGSTVESPLIHTLLDVDRWAEKKGQLLLYQKGKVVARWNPSTYTNKNLSGIWQLNYICDHSAPFYELYPITNCPSMIFTEGKNMATGFSGCHEFSCTVMINCNSMVFAESPMQDTTCHGNGENIFLSYLNAVNAYTFKDNKTLVLIADDKPVMAFTRFTRESSTVSRNP